MSERGPDESLLKAELDRLRLENQELWSALRRFDESPFLIRALGRVAVRRLRELGSRLRRPRSSPEEPRANTADFAPTFRPYEVRRLRMPARSRPRVLHGLANAYTGGSTRLVVDLVEHLGHRFEQVVVVRDNPPSPHYVGLELRAVPTASAPDKALALLRELRPHLLHVHFLGHHRNRYSQLDWAWYDGLFQAAAAYGCPVIENVNIPVAPYFSDTVRCYVFVSDYVRSLFGRDGDRSVTIYPGSDFALFNPSRERTSRAECLGMAYRLERDKLDESAIEVFVEALRRRPNARALIVGGGVLLEPFRERVQREGLADSVTFSGYVGYEDLRSLFAEMSVFVAPPHRESFGHVVPIAMNMEIPVAAYAVGALPEILDEALVPAGDVEALAARAIELMDDVGLRRRIVAKNRERAQRLFSVEKMVQDYGALYHELLP
jgi:glycosyltransferase involved in cell wall biosynthesis